MNFNYRIEEFDPGSASDDLWDKYFILLEGLFKETNPLDPLPSRDFGRKSATDPHPYIKSFRYIITPQKRPETIIGRGIISYETEISPSYKTNGHIIYGQVDISKNYRRLKLGTECLKTLISKSQEVGKTIFQSNTILDAGHCFCKKLGGLKAIEGFENRLYLKNVDWNLMKLWKEIGSKTAEGVTIEVFSEISDKSIEEYTKLLTEVANQQPLGELESRSKVTPESQRLNERRWNEKGIQFVTMITREKDGSISGMTDRYYLPEEPHRIHVGITGVKEECRGRGLGKWLKAEMLFYIKEKYPSVGYEVTGNSTSNAPMLSINNRMGYISHSTHVAYKFNVADLAKKLGNLHLAVI